MSDLITLIGVAGCAVFGAIFLARGIVAMFAKRNTPERLAELERIEAHAQRFMAWRRRTMRWR